MENNLLELIDNILNNEFGLCIENQYNNIDKNSLVTITNGVYKVKVKVQNILNKNVKVERLWFACKNPYIIDNINKLLVDKCNGNFTCLSSPDECIDRETPLKFVCNRCGEIVYQTVHNIRKVNDKSGQNRSYVLCSNCDGRLESLHALVLKQVFKHYYPDTIEEDPSCINPYTNCVMKTDIVNHRLKIAIEVQGGWHKREKQQFRDAIKKQYWIDRNYAFYDYDIENVSVLDYIRYFFPDLNEIPEWVKYYYSNKLNLKQLQIDLDSGMKVNQVAAKNGVNIHRIYDALHDNKLHYPDEYIKSTRRPIVLLDMHKNYLATYGSYSEGAKALDIDVSGIITCVYKKTYYSNGYFWVPKDLYDSNNYTIPESRYEKFYYPVAKLDVNNNVLETFENMICAANDIGVVPSNIYAVASGERNTVRGFKYKLI